MKSSLLFWTFSKVFSENFRVPISTGKMKEVLPVMDKSGNFKIFPKGLGFFVSQGKDKKIRSENLTISQNLRRIVSKRIVLLKINSTLRKHVYT